MMGHKKCVCVCVSRACAFTFAKHAQKKNDTA